MTADKFYFIQLKRLLNAVLDASALSFSLVCPSVFDRYFTSNENQSQKFALSLSCGGCAFDSRQSPRDPARKNLQFLHERKSLRQSMQT